MRIRGFAATTLTAAGLAAGAALLVPATASADPTELVAPLLNSTCSFAQVDAALHDKAPQLASILDNNPDQKAELKAKFDQPVEQRRAEFQQYLAQHPDEAQRAQQDPRAAGLSSTIQEVADSCHNY
ncbi:hemophore-related protein [Nocardia nova]|uniref:Hemophore-related protein n=1 Tax=Nocardia nova TaxID=37330 RepID=A0A2S6AXP1_9NOCA|nr:hemophore-related protein [Nocardia nova]PPJ34176.1 hemophore-related protein [Nocardia nova]PPJ40017.1 hemophore-related protein [Nocardia nova]